MPSLWKRKFHISAAAVVITVAALFLCPFSISVSSAQPQEPIQDEEITDNDLINAVRAGSPLDVDVKSKIVRLLIQVKKGDLDPEGFYKEVSKLQMDPGKELRHMLMEVKKDVGNHLGENGLSKIFGGSYGAGGSVVEEKILSHRKQVVMDTVKQAIEIYAKTNPQFSFYYGEVGGWPKESFDELKFAGDIDFNFLSGDLDSAMALKKIFDDLITQRYGRTPEELDIPCTVHGMATAEVYVGKHGQAFAEEATKDVWPINFDESKGPIGVAPRGNAVPFKEALTNMVLEAKQKGAINALDDLAVLKWPNEPGTSLEMIRHFEHDIIAKNVYTDLESFVKAAKYAQRSFDAMKKDVGPDAIKNKTLWLLTEELTIHKKSPKKQVALIREYYESIGKPLPFEVNLAVNADGKSLATIKANEALIREFWNDCRQTMWEGANVKIRQIIADMNQKIASLADTDGEGAKAIYEELSKYHEMLEVEDLILRDDKAGVHEHLDPQYQKLIVDFRQTVSAFKQKIAKNGLLKYIDPQQAKTYAWVEGMLKAGHEFNVKMAAGAIMAFPGKVNDVLDFLDDTLLTKLRQGEGDEYIKILRKGRGHYWGEQADLFLKGTPWEGRFTQRLNQMEAEYSGQLTKISQWLDNHFESRLASRGLGGIQAVNNAFNQSVASSTAGQRMMGGMMIYNLKEELPVYYNLAADGKWDELAGEFFKRRVPLGGAVERAVMGDYYGVAWELTSTLIPPVAVFSAAASIGEYVATTGLETYFDEEMEVFIDNLYDGAKFAIDGVQTVGGDIKISSWQLLSLSYSGKELEFNELLQMETDDARDMAACLKQPSDQRSGCFPMEKRGNGLFEWWRNTDAFEHHFRKTDPWIQMVMEMEKDPHAGAKLKEHFLYQKWARLEAIKVDFLKRTKVKLEERRAGEQALLSGQFLKMYDELMLIADELDIRQQLQAVIDEKFGGEVTQFMTWMKDSLRGAIRQLSGDVDVWDIYEELAAFVTKNLEAYKLIFDQRSEAEKELVHHPSDQGLRILTGPYFLTGDVSQDESSSKKWHELPSGVKAAMTQKLRAIKNELKAVPAELDLNEGSYDIGALERLVYHDSFREMWKKVNSAFTDVKIPSYLGQSPAKQTDPVEGGNDQDLAMERFAYHAKQVDAILEEFRKHYESQATQEGASEGEGEQEAANNLAELKARIEALAAQAIADEIAALEDTFNDELKELTRAMERISKELMHIERDLSALTSLANQMDAKNAQASKAADDAYASGEKCAMARGEMEKGALGICQLAESIKATDNVVQLDQLIERLRGENGKVSAQEDIFRKEMASSRASSRQADEILKEMSSLRSKREESKAALGQQETVITEIPAKLSRLDSLLSSMQENMAQLKGVVGEAAGIVGEAQQNDPDQLSKEDKKILKQIESAYGRISKLESQAGKVYERNKSKLDGPKDKLTNLHATFSQAKSKLEALLSMQINDEAIATISRSANEAKASYDAAEVFEDSVGATLQSVQTCSREAEKMHAKKTSPEAQVAQWDCSGYPGTVAEWNPKTKSPWCVCTSGNLWDENLNRCVTEEHYYTSRIDCSQYGANVRVGWDAGARQALCYCNDGYEWNNQRNACRVAAHIQVSQTNCSQYPGTIAQWDPSVDGVRCNCPGGYYWDGARCSAQQQPQGGGGSDWTQVLGGLLDSYNQGAGGASGGGSGTTSGASSGCTPGRTAAEQVINQSLGCPTTSGSGSGTTDNTGGRGWTNTGYQGGGGGGTGGGSNSGGVDTSNPGGSYSGSGGGGGRFYRECCANGLEEFMGQGTCIDGSPVVGPCQN